LRFQNRQALQPITSDLLFLRIQVVQIELGGLDRAMSEDLLEIVDVSAAPQIIDDKLVAQVVKPEPELV